MPFLENEINEDIFDITTCYGYGGPISSEIPKDCVLKQFRNEFKKFCEKENIITEFIRFSSVISKPAFGGKVYAH